MTAVDNITHSLIGMITGEPVARATPGSPGKTEQEPRSQRFEQDDVGGSRSVMKLIDHEVFKALQRARIPVDCNSELD